jgi:hypothetical protein
LPSLDTLCFADQINNENRRHRSCVPLFDFLKEDDCAFLKNKLKQLYIDGFSMTKSDVVSFFNDVLQEYPNVCATSLWNNQIETLQGVGPDLIMNPNSNTRHNLTTISITGNPFENKLVNNDENERKALLDILLKFPRVSCLGMDLIDGAFKFIDLDKYGPDIEYALRINYAGRILVERSPPPAVADNDTTIYAASRDVAVTSAAPPTSQFSWNIPTFIVWNDDMVPLERQPYDGSIIPLSVWPIVFERAAAAELSQPCYFHGRGLNQYTGLFYLLQKNQPYIEYMANLNAKTSTNEEEDATTININAINAFTDTFSGGTTATTTTTSSQQLHQEDSPTTPTPTFV